MVKSASSPLVSRSVVWDAVRVHESRAVTRTHAGPRAASGQGTGAVALTRRAGTLSGRHSMNAHGLLVGEALHVDAGKDGRIKLGGAPLGRRAAAYVAVKAAAAAAGRPDLARAALARFARLTAAKGAGKAAVRATGRKARAGKYTA